MFVVLCRDRDLPEIQREWIHWLSREPLEAGLMVSRAANQNGSFATRDSTFLFRFYRTGRVSLWGAPLPVRRLKPGTATSRASDDSRSEAHWVSFVVVHSFTPSTVINSPRTGRKQNIPQKVKSWQTLFQCNWQKKRNPFPWRRMSMCNKEGGVDQAMHSAGNWLQKELWQEEQCQRWWTCLPLTALERFWLYYASYRELLYIFHFFLFQ